MAWFAAFAISAGRAGAGTQWATGPALEERLAKTVNITWEGNPLRQALTDLSRAQGVAVLIDRRVDPGRKLDLSLEQVRLGAALQDIARRQGLGVSRVGPVAYFGPPGVAARLRTVTALRTNDVGRLPPTAGRLWLASRPMAWKDFATPRELLTQLAEQNGLVLHGLQPVPHDLWAAADLPPLTLVQRLTLIAVQFNLTFEVAADGKTVTLVPLPDDVAIVRSYDGGRQPQEVARQYAALAPNAQIKVVGPQIQVRGLLEDHEWLASPTRAGKPPPRPPRRDAPEVRFDNVVVREAPVGRVLQDLAKRANLDLRIDRQGLAAAEISLDQRVSINLQNVTVDELIEEVVKSTRLRWSRRGNVLEIGPAR
jgi:hypothetical protein